MAIFPHNDIIALVGQAPRFDLGESTGPDLSLSEIWGNGAGAMLDLSLGYGSAAGDVQLRSAVADSHGVGIDDVVITAGAQHALFLLAFTLCDPGDEAIVTCPGFPMPAAALNAVKASPRSLMLAFDHGYQPDLAGFRALLSKSTKLVCLASPHNPSGAALTPAILRDMLRFMAECAPAARLCIDETYRQAAYGTDAIASSALTIDPRIISLSSLSKCHGAPGLRIGWIATREAALRGQLLRAKFNTIISCPPLSERLAYTILSEEHRILGERRAHLARNL